MTCGSRRLTVEDPVQGVALPVEVLYPASEPERLVRFGPYSLEVARGAPMTGERRPLVVLSHGNNGTPWAYRDMAKHLARSGFVVALPEHLGNSRSDNRLERTAANLVNRPRHLSLAIDALLADAELRDRVATERVGVIGHSIGGYTGLAAAGGCPWAAAHESADGRPHPVEATADARVGALVLLCPATFWFIRGSLSAVRAPILIVTGEKDEITPASHAAAVIGGVPDAALVEHRVIPGAGHFSVMSRFPPEMCRPEFPPSQDPEGFDREAIQPELFGWVTEFLRRTLR